VAESLPLSIYRVDTSPGKNIALLDKPLPINLILILFARVRTCNLENLDEFSDCEASSLTLRSTMMILVAVMMMAVLF
jgi:hypothetical protein